MCCIFYPLLASSPSPVPFIILLTSLAHVSRPRREILAKVASILSIHTTSIIQFGVYAHKQYMNS